MNSIITLFKRDFNATVNSNRFLLLTFFCVLFWSIVFIRWTVMYAEMSIIAGQPGQNQSLNIHSNLLMSYFSWINIFLLFVVPVVTMGFIADERRAHTFELLMTSPVRPLQIVFGKYLAGISLGSILVCFGFVFPLILSIFADIDFGALLSAFFGFLLVVALYTAIGMFSSSVTSSATVAVVLGIVLNLSLFLVAGTHWRFENQIVSQLVQQSDVASHVNVFLRGEFQLASMVSVLSLTSVFLFLSERMLEAEKWR
ncbi:MAG: ABC transporter permease subunit [Bdellovibrionales bacterium]